MIPKVNQVPVRQPMYVNGQLHQVWISFFEKLGLVADETGTYSLSGMSQKIEEMQSVLESSQGEIQALKTQVTNLTQSLNTLSSQYSALEQRVTTLENAP